MGTFVISKRTNGEFQFNLQDSNGQFLLRSEGYSAKANCDNGVESVKKNSQDESKFDAKISSNDKFYFNLKASNGQIIGTSGMFDTEADRTAGMAAVKSTAVDADIDNQAT